jgi:hypothetical protein
MLRLNHCSLPWYFGMVICWHDLALNGPLNTSFYKAVVEVLGMDTKGAARILEGLQVLYMVDVIMPWQVDSSLCIMHCN